MSGELHRLAEACFNGACNPHGIIRSLSEAISEVPAGRARDSVELKIIVGQLSFLLGESLGPREETIQAYKRSKEGHRV